MRTFYKLIFAIAILFSIFISCSKEEDRKGCTDEAALNYNTLAVVDDGSCEFLDSTITIWNNGAFGFWGDVNTGSFEVKSCFTDTTTIFLNPDTTITPADTVIDNNVTPPDTTITPADTTINGDTYLLVNSDAQGHYGFVIQLLNKKEATDFKDGQLVFTAKLHPEATMNTFEIMIHGNHTNSWGMNCPNLYFSDPVNISSSILDTNNFQEISIPLTSFTNRHMESIDFVFGIKGTNATPNSSLIMINNIRWEAKSPD